MIRSLISPTGNPFQGKSEFEYLWHKLRWRFANGEHRDLFAKDPDRYAPQYDGYCAMGAAEGDAAHKDTVDPEAWAIVDGKLYLTHMHQAMDDWRQNPAEYIARADENWAAVKDLAEPVILGPPCATSPPSTLVALRDGGHWVVVGPETARDESGKIVGKGDMGVQLEQVGKNVEACLKVAGASLSDIIETRTYVADPDQLAKYADLRKQYFGSACAGPDDRSKRVGLPTPTISSRSWPSPRSDNRTEGRSAQRNPAFFSPSSMWSRASCVPNCAAKVRASKNGERRATIARSPLGILVLPSLPVCGRKNRMGEHLSVASRVAGEGAVTGLDRPRRSGRGNNTPCTALAAANLLARSKRSAPSSHGKPSAALPAHTKMVPRGGHSCPHRSD